MTTRQPTPGVHENFASEISSSPDPQSQKWYPWNGGDMPVPRGTAVEVILRYGKQVVEQAGGGYATRWSHDGPMGGHDDIVFYRLHTPSPQSLLEGEALTKLVNSDGILWRLNEEEQKALFKRLAANIGRDNAKMLLDEIELSHHRWRNPPPQTKTHVNGERKFCDFPNCDCSSGAAERCSHPPVSNLSVPTTAPWQWFAGSDEEWCTVGPEDSRDAIIQAATSDRLGETDDDGSWKLAFHIVEARQDPLRLADWIECDRLIERAEDNVADSDRTGSEYDDGPWFKCTPEQEKDLEERIKRACDEWQAAHGLVFSCSTFSHTRNQEHVVVDLAIEALATTEGSDNANS